MRKTLTSVVGAVLLAGFLLTGITGVARAEDWKDRLDYLIADGFRLVGYSLVFNADKNLSLYTDIPNVNADGTVNTVIEIPAGTDGKWEVTEENGVLSWELKNGKPRMIKYLAYPWNYGMIPRTMGGDGDSLDCLSLGEMKLRGSVVGVKIIGVLRILDAGLTDDKFLAVLPGSTFWEVNNLTELQAKYPGVLDIVQIWIENYKGPGAMVVTGIDDVDEAWEVLNAGIDAYNSNQ